MYIFEKYEKNRHLKLEIALAIAALNGEKYNWNNSAGQGLMIIFLHVRECMCKSLDVTYSPHNSDGLIDNRGSVGL